MNKVVIAFIGIVLSIILLILSIFNLKNLYSLIDKVQEQETIINELKFELEYNDYVFEDSMKQEI